MTEYLLLLTALTAFHSYFFYSLWLLWKKEIEELSFYHGFFFADSANVVGHFWIGFFNFI
jgi:hypothetical protein